jgi:hypothetical protein
VLVVISEVSEALVVVSSYNHLLVSISHQENDQRQQASEMCCSDNSLHDGSACRMMHLLTNYLNGPLRFFRDGFHRKKRLPL